MSQTPRPDQPVARSEGDERLAKAVHDLRNRMNSLLMNTAVLGAKANEVPETLRPFIDRIAAAGRKCSDELTHVLEIVEELKPGP